MIQTLTKEKVAPAGTGTTLNRGTENYQDPATNVYSVAHRHLEMTPAMSAARILNTTIPIDFEHVRAEETLRQEMLAELRAWSVTVLHHHIHTQADAIRFRDSYSLVCGEVA